MVKRNGSGRTGLDKEDDSAGRQTVAGANCSRMTGTQPSWRRRVGCSATRVRSSQGPGRHQAPL